MREFRYHVTLYGSPEKTVVAKGVIQAFWETVKVDEIRPEILRSWKFGTDFEVLRLDSFFTEDWVSPSNYFPELSQKCPNVVFELSFYGMGSDFYSSVFKNGQMLATYVTMADDDDKDLSDEYYYLEAKRFDGLAAN
jgi:hypothetical protein